MITNRLPLLTAILIGFLTLAGLLFSLPAINRITLGWGSLLAAFALLLGILNLLIVHSRRLFNEKNIYSGILVISLLAVVTVAVSDQVGTTDGALAFVFESIQVPLEAAFASLLAFFLIFAGMNIFRRRGRSFESILFLVVVIVALIGNVVPRFLFVPTAVSVFMTRLSLIINEVVVYSGVRGLLIGIALGAIMLSIRLLLGIERPYNK